MNPPRISHTIQRLRFPFIFFAGVIAWLIQLLLGYALTPVACSSSKIPFYVLSLLAGVVTLVACVLATRYWQRRPSGDLGDIRMIEEPREMSAFIGIAGFATNVLFLLLIITTALVGGFSQPCPAITMPLP